LAGADDQRGALDRRVTQNAIQQTICRRGGAARDLKNLWPRPVRGPWNAHCKDALAAELSKAICRGDAKLADAQDEIRKDWRASYRGRIDPHGCESGTAPSPK